MNKFCLQYRRPLSCPIISWNKPKDKENQEVILLAILSCNFCKTFPAVQDCSKLHMLRFTRCVKKKKKKDLVESCWERFSRKRRNWVSSCCRMALGLDRAPFRLSWMDCTCFCSTILIGRLDLLRTGMSQWAWAAFLAVVCLFIRSSRQRFPHTVP